jgi:hypothetical protein
MHEEWLERLHLSEAPASCMWPVWHVSRLVELGDDGRCCSWVAGYLFDETTEGKWQLVVAPQCVYIRASRRRHVHRDDSGRDPFHSRKRCR